jgi:hypothetical protein
MFMSNETSVGQEYYSSLQTKAMDAVKGIFNSVLYPIQFPSQGDYMWYYQDANQNFNLNTFNYLSANVSPGEISNTIQLSAAGGFPNDWNQVTTSMIYSLSSTNQAQLDNYQKLAQTQQTTVISDYQTTYGTITDAQMAAAAVSTKIDYVISYIFGSVWSGSTPPLTYSTMSAARNLKDLLPKRPISSDTVINDVAIYLNMMAPVNGLQDKVQNGQYVIRSLKNNTTTPTANNGGMKTFDPFTGVVSPGYQVGYNYPGVLATIQNDLKNTGRVISLGMTTSSASGGQVSVSVEGKAGFSLGSWLTFNTTTSGSYDMSQVSGTSTNASVTMKWEGYSIIPSSPIAWQQATNVGWYYSDPVKQAVANEGKDVDGFKWVGDDAPYDMGNVADGGNFGLISNLLISNFPTIEITYSNANFSQFKQSWNQSLTGNIKLFGFLSLGSFSQGAYGSSYQQGADNSTFTVKFSASPAVVSVPTTQQTAFVIGGAVSNPGAQS